MCTTSESTNRLHNKSDRAFRRTFVREQEARVGRDDANKRECWKIECLRGEGGADQNLRATTTKRVQDAVARADRRCGIRVETINDQVRECSAHLSLEAFGATTQRPNACAATGGAACERLRSNAAPMTTE